MRILLAIRISYLESCFKVYSEPDYWVVLYMNSVVSPLSGSLSRRRSLLQNLIARPVLIKLLCLLYGRWHAEILLQMLLCTQGGSVPISQPFTHPAVPQVALSTLFWSIPRPSGASFWQGGLGSATVGGKQLKLAPYMHGSASSLHARASSVHHPVGINVITIK